MAGGRVRVSDVCGMTLLRDAELVGVESAPADPVHGVDLLVPRQVMRDSLTPGGVVVVALDAAGEVASEHLVDVALRRAHNAGSALVIVTGHPGTLTHATTALAAWLRLPLLVAPPEVSSVDVAIELRRLISDPDVQRLEVLQTALRRLPRGPRSPQEVRATVEGLLPDTNVFVLAGRGLTLEGAARHVSPEAVVAYTEETYIQHDEVLAVVLPLEGLDGTTSWWLVAERRRAGRLWLESASALLALHSGALLTWLVREQAGLERDARMRSTLLTEVMEHGEHAPPEVQALLAHTGWQLDGWHTGLHLRFHPRNPSPLAMRSVARDLAPIGLTEHSLVERSDGWSAWLTSPSEPSLEQTRQLGRTIERSLQPPAGMRVVVGIGAPHRDAAGIGRTLAEARQGCAVASTGTRAVTVRVLQEVGPSRLLLGWQASDALSGYSREILGELLEESEADVLQTLQAYLERACSTAQTARALGLHRNTVTKRIARAERLLGTTVSTPDTRLALQLALRVLRS